MHAKSESDVTSLAPSSPRASPKRQLYYVQSPSRDSHDGDKSSSMQATPVYNSPMESPSHPSSISRFSGTFRSSSGRKGNRKRVNDKGWPECNVILEEGAYDDIEDEVFSRRCQIMIALLAFVLLFTAFCLIIWGASRPYKPEVVVKVRFLVAIDYIHSTTMPMNYFHIDWNISLKYFIFKSHLTIGVYLFYFGFHPILLIIALSIKDGELISLQALVIIC